VEKLDTKACLKCGAPIQGPATGRPKAYCGQVCRRLAEFEIRRLTRQLETLEAERLYLEQTGVARAGLRDAVGRTHKQQVADVKHSIEAIESRLRALLSDGSAGGEEKGEA
jgi:hypothetical protein